MITRKFVFLLLPVFALTLFNTCEDNPTESDEPAEPKVSNLVIVVPPEIIPFIKELTANSIRFDEILSTLFPDFADLLLPDIVLVCPPTDDDRAPYGFIRIISGPVLNRDGDPEFPTIDGRLTDVFDVAEIDTTQQLYTSDIERSMCKLEGVRFHETTRDANMFEYDIGSEESPLVHNLLPGVDMEVWGDLAFTQSFDFSASIGVSWSGIKLKKITFNYDAWDTLALNVRLTGTLEEVALWDTTLYEHEFNPYTYWFYGVPIVIFPVLSVDMAVTTEGEASISTTIMQSANLNAYVKYRRDDNPRWSAGCPFTPFFDHTPIEASMSAAVTGSVGPTLDLLLYNVAGPTMTVAGYLELNADTDQSPWWWLDAGIKGTGGIDTEKIGYIDSWETEIFDFYLTIAQASETQCVTPQFSHAAGTYFGETLIAISTATDGAAIYYTMNGDEPDENDTEYSDPVLLTSDTVLKARAFKDDYDESATAAANYHIVEINSVMDFDGNSYETIVLGDQEWMRQNLKVTHYKNGEPIPQGFSNTEWADLNDTQTGAFTVYNDEPANADIYGNLYNGYSVFDNRGICPEGFHIPTDEEWMELEMYLGMSYEESHDYGNPYRGTDQGSQMAGNGDLWNDSYLEDDADFGTSGFLAIPGGTRSNVGCRDMNNICKFWSSTPFGSSHSQITTRYLWYEFANSFIGGPDKGDGNSIRCINGAPPVYGCTDESACNYDPMAEAEDGSCWYAANYYDCDGNCLHDADGDGVCDELEIYGCTDPEAMNYIPDATEEDGSCLYPIDSVVDYDGNSYGTIQLGDQRWMAENLKVTHYNNGDPIPTGFLPYDYSWADLADDETGAYCVYPWDNWGNNIQSCYGDCAETYGNLYNWYAVADDRGVCPDGFHIPSDEEFMTLEMFLGMSYDDAHDVGDRGTDQGSQLAGFANYWNHYWPEDGLEDNPAFGSSGFNAIPGGTRVYHYETCEENSWFWTSTAFNETDACNRWIERNHTGVFRYCENVDKYRGFSVRCVEDESPVYGCTDPEALNYYPEATEDDGSCVYSNGEIVDIDGVSYETVQIGEQIWMAENLKVTHYRNGDEIPTGHSHSEWAGLSAGAYAVYDDDPAYAETYGNLYNSYALTDDRDICPEGFHVPSDEEWIELEMALGMSYEDAQDTNWRGTDQGSQLAGLKDLWNYGNLENDPAFGTSGFLAISGGFRGSTGCQDMGLNACFWSSTLSTAGYAAKSRILLYTNTDIYRNNESRYKGHSVRCVGD